MDSFPGGKQRLFCCHRSYEIVGICPEWQYVMLPRCKIELKVKLSYQNTEQMGRRNEKIRRDEVSCKQKHLQCPTHSGL